MGNGELVIGMFEIEKAFIGGPKFASTLLDAVLVTTAVATFSTAVLGAPRIDKINKLALTTVGVSSLALFCANDFFSRKIRKIDECLEKAQWNELKKHLGGTEGYQIFLEEIQSKQKVIEAIAKLPEHQQQYWSEKAGVSEVMGNGQWVMGNGQWVIGDGNGNSSEVIGNGNGQWVIGDGQSLPDAIDDHDYSWIDAEFINSSKVVFGPKGSGKSYWLAYEAGQFLLNNPGGKLFIGDRHYDEEESLWLKGVSPEVLLKNFLSDKTEGILAIFQYIHKELLDRINSKDRKRPPIKFICDEFLGFIDELDGAQQKQVVTCIKQIQHQGRKYRIDITLGLHSIKKGESGIDSSVLFSMDTLALGDSITDRTNCWPASFSLEKLWQGCESIRRSGTRACVVRKLGESPVSVAMPVLQIPELSVDGSGGSSGSNDASDWYEQLKQWAIASSINPSSSEIGEFWSNITGKKLSSSAIALLQEKIIGWRKGNG